MAGYCGGQIGSPLCFSNSRYWVWRGKEAWAWSGNNKHSGYIGAQEKVLEVMRNFYVIIDVCLSLLLLLLFHHNVLDPKWICIHLLFLESLFLNSEWFNPYILSPGSKSWFPRWQWSLISMAFSGLSLMAFYHCTLFKSHLWGFLFLPVGLGSQRKVGRDHVFWTLCPIVNIPCTQ